MDDLANSFALKNCHQSWLTHFTTSRHNSRLKMYNLVVTVQYTKKKMRGLQNSKDQMLFLCYSCG